MLQAALTDCLLLDPLPFAQGGFIAAKVDVGGCDVVQTLVVALVVVIRDECANLTLKIAGKVVVFQEDTVFHGWLPFQQAFASCFVKEVTGSFADVKRDISPFVWPMPRRNERANFQFTDIKAHQSLIAVIFNEIRFA